MHHRSRILLALFGALTLLSLCRAQSPTLPTSPAPADSRLGWWRNARFGLFIHWGLYAIPAGAWGDKTDYGEWIQNHAHIPVEEYEKLQTRFNPARFDAHAWARAAKAAGMRYIVLTAKHHEGFCLFDSKLTDYTSTHAPFGRDAVRELSDACRDEGLQFCVYYSIMDWHSPDYLPRRDWESRPTSGADFDRYIAYMKGQLRELLTNYGPIGVLWFDGQWEGTWTHDRAADLYSYVRSLQPNLIVNNRIDKGGSSAHGMNRFGHYAGDFGTPEQEVPAMGYPGADWESCLTMNDHWGYNAADQHFKTAQELIRTLVDVASKGGNLLLNVGPNADGEIPAPELERLAAIGRWMSTNSESIYGTSSNPFPELKWGRCTQKALPSGGTRLYLHVFDWPREGVLTVPGLYSPCLNAHLLADPTVPIDLAQRNGLVKLRVPTAPLDTVDTVLVLDINGSPDVAIPPVISAPAPIFVGSTSVAISTPRQNIELRYTLDASDPAPSSPIFSGPLTLNTTTTVSARAFRDGNPVSPIARLTLRRDEPAPAAHPPKTDLGLRYDYFEGDWKSTTEFITLTPRATGVAPDLSRSQRLRESHFGFRYQGYIDIPADGAYTLYLASDDGSRLMLDNKPLIDNDGLHSLEEKSATAALARGLHPITIDFFESSGGHELELWWEAPGLSRQLVPSSALRCDPDAK